MVLQPKKVLVLQLNAKIRPQLAGCLTRTLQEATAFPVAESDTDRIKIVQIDRGRCRIKHIVPVTGKTETKTSEMGIRQETRPSSRVEEDLIGYRVLDLGSVWNASDADCRMRFKGTNYDVWV
jgi:hypothetical protein